MQNTLILPTYKNKPFKLMPVTLPEIVDEAIEAMKWIVDYAIENQSR